MKNFLLNTIFVPFLLLAYSGYAQVKSNPLMKGKAGDPQMKGKLQQLEVIKTSSKLSPALAKLSEKFAVRNLQQGAAPDALQKFMQIKGDKVLVDFTANDNVNAARAELQKMGVVITAVYGRVLSGYVPISTLPQLEAAHTIRFAKPSYKPLHQSAKDNSSQSCEINFYAPPHYKFKPVISQGDTAQLSYLARKKYHVTGEGVKVGILSDSYNNLGTAEIGVRHGELPGKENPFGARHPVQVIKDIDSGGTDEGRAMLEIVHDVAPRAELAFYTAYDGEADFAQGIQTLADNGCKVIGDDEFYYDEPYFQDGIIAQSVNEAKKKGVTYFSAAGNQFILSYESKYRPTDVEPFGPGYGTAHNFSAPGDVPRYSQPLYVPSGGSVIIGFQWDQSSFAASGVGATTDFDMYLSDIYGNIVAEGASDNILSGEPFEILGYENTSRDYTFFLTIVKYAGPDVKRLKYILYNDAEFYLTDPAIPGILAPSLVGHTKAEGAISTGAAFYLNTPPYGVDTALVEYFSAEGGVANYFDIHGNRIPPQVLRKPNIVAPDGGNTSFFDPFGNGDIVEDADSYPNFFGTSAATPHAAGVAALMIDAQKLNTITPDQIKGILSAKASDMDDIWTDGFDKGFDYNTGYGFINAEKAVCEVKFPNLYIKDLKLEPLCSDNPCVTRNWKIINPNPFPVEAAYFVAGSQQHNKVNAEPGSTLFTTTTVTSNNFPVPNIAILSWKDNFDFKRFDLEFSTKAKCGNDLISERNSDRLLSATPGITGEDLAIVNLAEVYPNPSTKTFSLYLSLATQQPINIELYSIDGRKLLAKTVNQSKGIFEIDAGGYRPGIYILNVRQGNFSKTLKLVKQ